MSRIDTEKLQPASSDVFSSRMTRAVSRNGVPPLGGTVERGGLGGASPFAFPEQAQGIQAQGIQAQEVQGIDVQEGGPLAIGLVSDADLETVSGIGGERLLSELSRIEIQLMDRFGSTRDPDLRGSLDAGLSMIGETVRRLRLVHGGHDALVLKR